MAIDRKSLLNDAGRYEEAMRLWKESADLEKIPEEKRQRPDLVFLDGRKSPSEKHVAPDTFEEVVSLASKMDGIVAWRLRLQGAYLASGRIPS